MTMPHEAAPGAGSSMHAGQLAPQLPVAAILAGLPDGITVQDASGRLVYANDAAARLCGFPDAAALLAATGREILGKFEVYAEDGSPFSLDQLPGRRLFRGEAVTEIPLRFRVVATNDFYWSLVNATPVLDEAGHVVLAVNNFRDITERKQAEIAAQFLAAAGMELTRSLDYEQTLQRVASLAVPALADWCVVDLLDEQGQLRRVAAAHIDPTRARLAMEVAERFPVDLNAPAGVPLVLRTGRSSLMTTVTDAQLEAAARNAEHLALLRSLQFTSGIIVPLVARGRTLGAITLALAESNRRYGQRDLVTAEDLAVRAALAIDNARLYREAQKQIEIHVELNAELRDTMERLQDSVRTRDEFLAAVSHDLKNPLASIKGMTQLLTRRAERPDGLTSGELREGLGRIDGVVTRASRLVEDLLDLARLHMGRPLDLDLKPVDLVALVQEIVTEQQQRSDHHVIRVESDLPVMMGRWDRYRLAQVIANLLDNSLKYSPDGGEVRVRLTREDNGVSWVVLAVEDDGVGIPLADVGRIFERFQRGSNVAGFIPGTGIGLASARQIVRSHGGEITVSGGPGRGAVVTVRLPINDAGAPVPAQE